MSNRSDIDLETPVSSTLVKADAGETRRRTGLQQRSQFLVVILASIMIASVTSHLAAAWFGLQIGKPMYRRIGPTNGPQVFCAGSSVVQFGLAWPEVSAALGQGIENWGLAGSSPEIWEVSQLLSTNSNLMIIGVSVHDLNEYYVCDSRANIVGFGQTIQDLWHLKAGWPFSQRLLSQYPLTWLRILFPTAGKSDAFLVGLRRKLRALTRSSPTADDQANFLVLPSKPVLNFGDSNERMSDWPKDKAIRRLALLRNEIRGRHGFEGPKKLAFFRMLDRARQHGGVLIVVMPVAPTYVRELLKPEDVGAFENVLAEAQRAVPQARFIRLDHLSNLNSDAFYSDFVHLNAAGRRIVTEAFLKQMSEGSRQP